MSRFKAMQNVFLCCSYFAVPVLAHGSFYVRLEGTKVSAITARVLKNRQKKGNTVQQAIKFIGERQNQNIVSKNIINLDSIV